jgi:hypothetical protein
MTATTYYAVDTNSGGTFPVTSLAAAKRAEFMTALATSKVETFEFSIAGSRPSDDFTLYLFGSTCQLTQAAPIDGNVQGIKTVGQDFPGRFNTTIDSGSGLLEDGKWWQSSGEFTLKFTSHTQAFGFYGTDFGDLGAAGGTVKLSFYSNGFPVDLNVEVGPDTSGINATLLFFGYTNDVHPFNEIRFTVTQGPGTTAGNEQLVGFDDMVYGTLDSIKLPYNGVGSFVNAPTQCITSSPPEDQNVAYINVPAGFKDRWSVWTCLSVSNATPIISIYSGVNGTGTLLAGPSGVAAGLLNAFYQTVFYFSGVARSIKVTTGKASFNNEVFFDHMEFGTPPDLPDAPILTFNWELGGLLTTSSQSQWDGVKYGMDFEGLIPGANASAGTYAPVSVGSFYDSLYPGTVFTNAVAVRSKATGGTAQFNVRTLDSPSGAVLNLGKTALKVATGQASMTIALPSTSTKGAISFYYASASPVTLIAGVGTKTLPATGTCSLPDVDNVYCQWKLCRLESENATINSLTISSADPNMMVDNLTNGYPIPLSGALPTVDNLVDDYFNNGTDSRGISGPLVPSGPPYPHIYGVQAPSWVRACYSDGPEIAPDFYYKSGEGIYPGIYSWTALQNLSNDPKYINVVDGFINECSLFVLMGTIVGVYSGLNGTGTLLQSTPDVQHSYTDGGYTKFTFGGWARSIAFDTDPAIVDGLRFGYSSTNSIIPTVPSPEIFDSDSTNIVEGVNQLTNDSETPIIFLPDGLIYRDTQFSPSASHWMREPTPYSNVGTLVQFSFDGLTDGATAFPNSGTLGGTWSSTGSNCSASTNASKWGTSSLHVTPNNSEHAIKLIWPTMFYLRSQVGTLEAWVRPEVGASEPYGKTAIMYWIYGYGNTSTPWNQGASSTGSAYTPGMGIIYAHASTTPGQTVLEAWLNQRFIGSISVANSQFHHVAFTLNAGSGGQFMTFFVNGAQVATGSVTGVNYSNPDFSLVVVGQSDRTGTFSYYLSDVRLTRGTQRYTGAYTLPTAAFTAQTPYEFEGQTRWIRAYPVSSAAGEQDPASGFNIPDAYAGEELYTWHKMDVPRSFGINHRYNNLLTLRFQIATDSAGANIVAESLGNGAANLKGVGHAIVGGAQLIYRQTTLLTQGKFEVFTDQSTFSDARNALRNRHFKFREETFESFTSGSATPLVLNFVDEADGSLITCTVTGSAVIASSSATGQRNTTVAGQRWLSLSGPTTFTFDSPITAFGCYTTDIGDGGYVKLLLTDTTGTVKEVVLKHSLAQASGLQNYIGFHHPGNEYVSVTISNTTTFGDMGIDDLFVGTRSQLNQLVQTLTSPFTASALSPIGSSRASNGGAWVDLYGNNSHTALVETGAGTVQVDTSKVGNTRYGVYLDKGTSTPDVTLFVNFNITPLFFVQPDLELGVIARKNGNDYYHLTYTYYAAGAPAFERTYDNGDWTTMVTLTHYPSGEVLFGPYYYSDPSFGTIRWDIQGNTHTLYVESFYGNNPALPGGVNYDGILCQIVDDRNLTGTQHGFTIKQPSL